MSMMIRLKVVKIGNSREVRIPRTLLEQAGLTTDVEMRVDGNKLIIQSAQQMRKGWGTQFAAMAAHGDDQQLVQGSTSQWDEDEWTG
jgi:antitoxin MazE